VKDDKREPREAAPRRCFGCGAALQCENEELPGFVPRAVLEREEDALCRRCFRIRHYNEISAVTADRDAFLRLLGGIAETDCLVVHIADLFDMEGSLITGLHRFVGRNPVLLVANKLDLLPKITNRSRLLAWVLRQARRNGLEPAEAVLCSARRNEGVDRLAEAIRRLAGGRDVYVVGATNVGKSALINRLIAEYGDFARELTVSRYPGTTLDAVRIPLRGGMQLVDTPGIVYSHRLTEIVPRRALGAVLPERPFRPLTYQLNARQTLFFGGLVRFDFLEGERQSFTAYVSPALRVHRTKLERADGLFAAQRGKLLVPPSEEDLERMPPLERHELRIGSDQHRDVFVSGLGWIKANSTTGALVALHVPKGVRAGLREVML